MVIETLEDGAERFVTQGGVTITRRRHETPYEGAIDAYIDALNARRGCVFSSNYEYPGRYTRWDTAIVDPPLAVTARLTLDQKGFIPDQDLLLGPRVWDIRHPNVDPGGV